ncbi:MAG: homogentisate 1,2-dioxygenase [Pseudomonadota bacterium]
MDPALTYLCGFGNQHLSEAVPGSLPVGQNNPQHPPHGLYPELLSGTAFTAPRAANLRTWMYRIRPSVQVGAYQPMPHAGLQAGAGRLPVPPNPLRWRPWPVPAQAQASLNFVTGLQTLATQASHGVSVHLMRANQDMHQQAFINADGEFLIVPQQGRLRLVTELGLLDVAPWELAVIPRGLAFKVTLPDGAARAFVCENQGAALRLPELGLIGSNGLAQARDFLVPVAAIDGPGRDQPHQLIKKFGDRLWVAPAGHSPFNVVAWHGNLAPCKYDMRRFVVLGSVSVDHPDPSIFTVLSSPSDTPGVSHCDFVIFPPRWLVAEHTFRPPWFHRNVMSEFMGLIDGQYDAKPEGFAPGGFSLHNSFVPHGPDALAVERASQAVLAPEKLDDTLAFMLESRERLIPSDAALEHGQLDARYADCWTPLKDRFQP